MKRGLCRYTILMLALLALGGCGTVADPTEWFGSSSVEPPNELEDFEPTREPVVLWSADVDSGTDDQRLHLVPGVYQGQVFVASADGRVKAFDARNGKTLWDVELDVPISGGPGVGEGIVVVGTSDADVIALNASDGSERWRGAASSEILSSPAVGRGVVVVQALDGRVTGLDAGTGVERWRYSSRVPSLTLRGSGSPVMSGNAVFCGLAGGKLVALDITSGDLLWDANVTVPGGRSELERLADIDGDPLVRDGAVYVATYQGEVAAFGESSGISLWRHRLSVHGALAADWRSLFAADENGILWSFDVESGRARWSQDSLRNRGLSDAVILGDSLVVGDFEGYVHFISATGGTFQARMRVGSDAITKGIRVEDGVLYVQNDDGTLKAIALPEAS